MTCGPHLSPYSTRWDRLLHVLGCGLIGQPWLCPAPLTCGPWSSGLSFPRGSCLSRCPLQTRASQQTRSRTPPNSPGTSASTCAYSIPLCYKIRTRRAPGSPKPNQAPRPLCHPRTLETNGRKRGERSTPPPFLAFLGHSVSAEHSGSSGDGEELARVGKSGSRVGFCEKFLTGAFGTPWIRLPPWTELHRGWYLVRTPSPVWRLSTLCIDTSGETFWARDHGLTASGDAAAVATLVATALRRAGGDDGRSAVDLGVGGRD
jgi:hypothetical protein